MVKPNKGDTVYFVLDEGRSKGAVRAAEVSEPWGPECDFVNLLVKLDGPNDAGFGSVGANVVWRGSVHPTTEAEKKPGCWFPKAVTA